ncbi:MAG: hypothetical protein ABI690_21190 [Chloroflexota bacterium]
MAKPPSAALLLAGARELYDDPHLSFASAAQHDAWKSGFASGADWMRMVLCHLRGQTPPTTPTSFQQLGVVKYGLAALCALLFLGAVIGMRGWVLLPGVVFVFYAVEAQMVFLFPLALDGSPNPIRESLAWTRAAGGTIPVMLTVMQLAAVMLFGGFFGRGFIRSWCLGCLAVVLWYEALRRQYAPA